MERGRWTRALSLGLFALACNALLGGPARPAIALLSGSICIGLTVSGARRLNPEVRQPWTLIAAGGGLFLFANLVRAIHGSIIAVNNPFPSPADAFIYLGYASLILGMLALIRARGGSEDRDNIIDASIVAAGIGVIVWAFLVAPYVRQAGIPLTERVMTGGFSVLDLVLVTLTARVAVGPGARTISYYLLAGAMGLVLAANVLATLESSGRYDGPLLIVLPSFAYVFVAAAANHPSMRRLAEPALDTRRSLTRVRLLLLSVALLMSPAVVVWELTGGHEVDLPVVLTGWIVLGLLVLVRLVILVQAKERVAVQEQILREGSASLATSTGRHMMNRNTLRAVSRLAGGSDRLRVSMALVVDRGLQVVDAVGHRADEAIGTATQLDSLPEAMTSAFTRRAPVALKNTWPIDLGSGPDLRLRSLLVAPLMSHNELSGAIIITTARPLPTEAQRSIESLASTVSLALESAMLTENLLRRKSERRFRALVENSSDIVLVVSSELRITFVSPAAHRLLGFPDMTILGTHPGRWIHPADREMASAMFTVTSAGKLDTTPLELRLRHADGRYRWFEVRTRDSSDDAEIAGVVVNAREITDRKATEELLATSEARFRALVQHSSDIVAVVDLDGRFSFVSPAITSVLGHLPEDLLGTRAVDLLPHDEFDRLRQSHAIFVDHDLPADPVSSSSMEVQLQGLEGEWHTVDITLTDLRHEPAVGGVVLNARDVTVRKALERDLLHQARHDALTGLANRAMFTDRVTETLRTADERFLVGTLFIDIDDFKTVNDSLGHAVGDELLIVVAERLLTCLHPADVAARLGGDEFAVLVVAPWGETEIIKIAERVLLTLQAPFTVQGREIRISASVGIAIDANRSSDAEVLLRNADMAMYLAKERGKARFEVFEERMHASVFERLELKADLARGIETDQLRLLYQPIVSLQTGRITGVEALVRWDHPVKGMLPPDAFIPVAEDTGLIVPLGQWVLEEACQQLQSLQLGLPANASLTMSVNLSVRQLQVEGIVDTVAATISRFGLDPSTITLEITESMLMHDTELTRNRLADLRDIGVSLAVDDFGTGYSSLQYIQRFPIDIIKIDRSFVSGLGEQAGDVVVVQSMIELAQRLGVYTVAEGIERPEQVTILQSLGADLGQGYYFSRPIPASAIGALLVRSVTEGARFLYQ
jgi:diguanylate cyclase (GGDEF)-like protein/PAS domain S-box-containing protein